MLTVEQVKAHSEISISSDPDPYGLCLVFPEDGKYTRIMARLLYLHNGHKSKMRIICGLPKPISLGQEKTKTEEEVRATIDWARFTRWINLNDDLMEINLPTREEWIASKDKIGRNALLDAIRNETIDCNKIVLV